MPHDRLWRDVHKVNVWELLAFPKKYHSSSESKTSWKYSVRGLGTAVLDH